MNTGNLRDCSGFHTSKIGDGKPKIWAGSLNGLLGLPRAVLGSLGRLD